MADQPRQQVYRIVKRTPLFALQGAANALAREAQQKLESAERLEKEAAELRREAEELKRDAAEYTAAAKLLE